MPEIILTESTIKAALALLILFASIVSFVRERISPDLTALLAVLALLLTGILTPLEAFAGLSHPATVFVAAAQNSPPWSPLRLADIAGGRILIPLINSQSGYTPRRI